MDKIITRSEQDTINFASEFAKKLKPGNIVLLSGELRIRKNKICPRYFKTFRFRK